MYSQNLIISISSGGKEAILYVNTEIALKTFQPYLAICTCNQVAS